MNLPPRVFRITEGPKCGFHDLVLPHWNWAASALESAGPCPPDVPGSGYPGLEAGDGLALDPGPFQASP